MVLATLIRADQLLPALTSLPGPDLTHQVLSKFISMARRYQARPPRRLFATVLHAIQRTRPGPGQLLLDRLFQATERRLKKYSGSTIAVACILQVKMQQKQPTPTATKLPRCFKKPLQTSTLALQAQIKTNQNAKLKVLKEQCVRAMQHVAIAPDKPRIQPPISELT